MMTMNPKYKYGDIVSFKCNNKKHTGEVYIIDAHGTFERPDVVSYDILVKDENILYKHIGEDELL